MRWKKYTLYTREEAVDLVSASFAELGIEGIEIEDNAPLSERDTKGMFIDILPELPPDDGTARVSFYLEPGSGEEEMLCRVREELEELSRLTDLGEARIEESLTEDKDWINNWKTFFHPFVVDDLLIKPTWEQVPAESAGLTCIQIDPGTAFGTGAHETTQLCIRALNRYMKLMQAAGVSDIRVLDVERAAVSSASRRRNSGQRRFLRPTSTTMQSKRSRRTFRAMTLIRRISRWSAAI